MRLCNQKTTTFIIELTGNIPKFCLQNLFYLRYNIYFIYDVSITMFNTSVYFSVLVGNCIIIIIQCHFEFRDDGELPRTPEAVDL